jgi:hypothetical protein
MDFGWTKSYRVFCTAFVSDNHFQFGKRVIRR